MKDKKSYSDKLRDPRWQKKRLQILERDNWTCLHCGSTENTLHVHHTYYEKGKEPWEADEKCLKTLCSECHEVEPEYFEEQIHDLRLMFKQSGIMSLELIQVINSIRANILNI